MEKRIDLTDDIAIVGVSCRFPGAENAIEFWKNLVTGKDTISEVPSDRWLWQEYWGDPQREDNKTNSKWGGFIKDADKFDPHFFGISPREAEQMDPQQRIALEMSWSCFEDAAITPSSLSGERVGVFVGLFNFDYKEIQQKFHADIVGHAAPGTSNTMIPNRISYYYNFHGPSVPIDTACSSALVALHNAVSSIKQGDCDSALVGAVNLLFTPTSYISFSKLRMLSPTGQCRTFDEQANGYVRGEGAGMVFIKRLSDAVTDNNRIYGIVKGSAVNHGGKVRTLTHPSPYAQSQVIQEAIQRAGVRVEDISYIEAHGTGTPLGDPIEIQGLKRAFSSLAIDDADYKKNYCGIGAVKTNIGHLESSAGMAGLIKILLSLKHNTLPAVKNFNTINPRIDLEESPFFIVDKNRTWQSSHLDGFPRTAGLSSFGFGGANAHVILQEFKNNEDAIKYSPEDIGSSYAIVLSAKTNTSLKQRARDLLGYINAELSKKREIKRSGKEYTIKENEVLHSLAYTLHIGREALEYRLCIVTNNIQDLLSKINTFISDENVYLSTKSVFTGRAENNYALLEPEASLPQFIKQRGLPEVAKRWVSGAEVEWKQLYIDRFPARLGLPTYPFARERYWLPDVHSKTDNMVVSVESDRNLNSTVSDLHIFSEQWLPQEIALQKTPDIAKNTYFIDFSPSHKNTTEFQELTGLAQGYISVLPGPISYNSTDNCVLSPGREEDYIALFCFIKKLIAEKEDNTKINICLLYRWQQINSPSDESGLLQIREILVATRNAGIAINHLTLVGRWREGELSACYHQSWIGFRQTLRIVMPELSSSLVYFDEEISEEKMWQECWQGDLVSYRQGHRYIAHTKSLYNEEIISDKYDSVEPKHEVNSPAFIQQGCYLIVGGCGGIGYQLATYLAKNYSAHLVLLGRRDQDQSISEKLDSLTRYGAHLVEYHAVDIADLLNLKQLFRNLKKDYQKINGIIHSAGHYDARSFYIKEKDEFIHGLVSKITGSINLDEATKELDLDFIVYFSSNSAMLGDFGGGDYASGNRFQMAYAQYRESLRKSGQRIGTTHVINWPLWRDGGIAVAEEKETEQYLASSGLRYLETEEAIEQFTKIIANGIPQQLILPGDGVRIERFLSRVFHTEIQQVYLPVQQEIKTPELSSSKLKSEYLESSSSTYEKGSTSLIKIKVWLKKSLKSLVVKILKTQEERVEYNSNFSDCGFDSIAFTDLSRALHFDYGIQTPPSTFYSYNTLDKLSDYLINSFNESLIDTYSRKVITKEENVASVEGVQEVQSSYKKTVAASPLVGKDVSSNSSSIYSYSDKKKSENINHGDDFYTKNNDIAIIGIAGRFPGADNPEEFWENLKNGVDTVAEVASSVWSGQEFNVEDIISTQAGMVSGAREFDPLFFEISPVEALQIEPRQRLLLQEIWHALEDASYAGKNIEAAQCGVFVGVEEGEYGDILADSEDKLLTGRHNGILAARISYFLDLKGPNLSLNTACSSGLVALHYACQSLRNNDCQMAIVGSVNTLQSPTMHVELSRMGMLSATGRCHTFDNCADGMVPAEAVCAFVLKNLSDAERDNDNIHGVIKASGINYDGRTSGITAPCGSAQIELINDIYTKHKINKQDVGYILTHGTGTKLGDPIEINALKETFSGDLERAIPNNTSCALGSTKTNIGHTLAVSGLVSVMGGILSLKNKSIPAVVGFKELNQHIDLNNTPFYVNSQTKEWSVVSGKKRLAGVSAFGMSGTNAHVVLEEHLDEEASIKRTPTRKFEFDEKAKGALWVFSAKNAERLYVVLNQYKIYLENLDQECKDSQIILSRIARTLQMGRRHLEQRLTLWVDSIDGALHSLNNILLSASKNNEVKEELVVTEINAQCKNIRKCKKEIEALVDDELNEERIKQWLASRNWKEIASYWVKGGDIDWNILYQGNVKPQFIPLPKYPFSQQIFWPEIKGKETGQKRLSLDDSTTEINTRKTMPHPLLSPTLTGDEFFLNEHIVNEKKILPGVAYLEFILASIKEEGLETPDLLNCQVSIEDITWLHPVDVVEDVSLSVNFRKYDENSYGFTIKSHTKTSGLSDHCEGKVVFCKLSKSTASINTGNIKKTCNHAISIESLYNDFSSNRIDYGPSFRCIRKLWCDSEKTQALVYVDLNKELHKHTIDSQSAWHIHPGLLDSIFQSAAVFAPNGYALLPFAIEKCYFNRPINDGVYGYIRRGQQNENFIAVNVTVINPKGEVCSEIYELTFKLQKFTNDIDKNTLLHGEYEDISREIDTFDKNFLFYPAWKPLKDTLIKIDDRKVEESNTLSKNTHRTIIICSPIVLKDFAQVVGTAIETRDIHCALYYCFYDTNEVSLTEQYDQWLTSASFSSKKVDDILFVGQQDKPYNQTGNTLTSSSSASIALFSLIKVLERNKILDSGFTLKIITTNGQNFSGNQKAFPWSADLAGLSLSFAREYPDIDCSYFDLECSDIYDIEKLHELAESKDLDFVLEHCGGQGRPIAIRGGLPYQKYWLPIHEDSLPAKDRTNSPYRQGGIYLILGGAGGLGLAFAIHLAKTAGATIILIGRSARDAAKRAVIDKVKHAGGDCEYFQADGTNLQQMREVVQKVTAQYGPINGVIHSAMVLADGAISRMDEAHYQQALYSKIDSTITLCHAIKDESLDFLLFFSSSQSMWGNAGQSNYAAGCNFKDSYAHYLSHSTKFPIKIVNWGYWGEIGVVASQEYQDRLASIGIYSLDINEGMSVIDWLIQSDLAQIGAIKASKDFLSEQMNADFSEVISYQAATYLPLLEHVIEQKEEWVKFSLNNEKDISQEILSQNKLTEFAAILVANVLLKLGFVPDVSKIYTQEVLFNSLNFIPKYKRLFHALISVLVSYGYLRLSDGMDVYSIMVTDKYVTLHKDMIDEKVQHNYLALLEENHLIQSHLRLLWACTQAMPDILQGKCTATDVIFPEGSMDLVEGVYRGSPLSDSYNKLVSKVVASYVKELKDNKNYTNDKKITILEFGAGTGGTTEFVLPHLKNYSNNIQYIYTDVSKSFLFHGREKFSQYADCIDFKLLNLSESPLEQGFELNSVDVILGTNVIHATPNINESLKNIRSLLSSHGVLVLNELTHFNAFTSMTFGLLDGWWLYDDANIRLKHTPLLTAQQWHNTLVSSGFLHAYTINPHGSNTGMEQSVVIAEKNCFSEPLLETISPDNASLKVQEKTTLHTMRNNTVANTDDLLERVTTVVSVALNINEKDIDSEIPFSEYGVDSILAVKIADKISKASGVKLRSTDLFNYTTLENLVGYIKEKIGNAFDGETAEKNYALDKNSFKEESIEKEDNGVGSGSLGVSSEVKTSTSTSLPNEEAYTQEDLEVFISSILSESLNISKSQFDCDTPFSEYGIDSILAVRVVNRLNKQLNIKLRTTDLFNYTTITHLSSHIFKEHGNTLKIDELLAVSYESKSKANNIETPSKADVSPKKEVASLGINNYIKDDPTTKKPMDIAVVGMSARFPGAENVDAFWENLKQGKDSVTDISQTRWHGLNVYDSDEDAAGKTYSKWAGVLDDIDLFDPAFFNISPREAQLMDPQQRVFLMECWKALEHSGHSIKNVDGSRCGVFVGCGWGDYQWQLMQEGINEAYAFTGNSFSILASRIAYFLNLKGPCLSIDTACSSSLVAIHLACESLCSGASDMALAGGVCLLNTPEFHKNSSRAGMLSPTGRCHTFDANADGFVPGEGAGVIVLKTLQQAMQDRDTIYGVIKGSGINQDGKTNGITAPNGPSQTQLECDIYDRFGIDPATISYVETHGTGTKLGDPIEIAALTDAFNKYTSNKHFCAVGSVKANIGHGLTAAGVASVIKVIQALRDQHLPPSANFADHNPHIEFDDSPFYVNTSLTPWLGAIDGESKNSKTVRRAAISSFGFSGTNAHVVMEEYDHSHMSNTHESGFLHGKPLLIGVSAKSYKQVYQQITLLARHISSQNYLSREYLENLSFTLLTGRTEMPVRLMMVCETPSQLVKTMESFIKFGKEFDESSKPKISIADDGVDFYLTSQEFLDPTNRETLPKAVQQKKADQAVQAWLNEGKARDLACAWVEGEAASYEIDWTLIFSRGVFEKLSLPTYPFLKKSYWYTDFLARDKKIKNSSNSKNGYSPELSTDKKQEIALTSKVDVDTHIEKNAIKENKIKLDVLSSSEAGANPSNQTLEPLLMKNKKELNNSNVASLKKNVLKEPIISSGIQQLADLKVDDEKNAFPEENGATMNVSDIFNTLKQQLADILYTDESVIDLSEKFVDLGIDSITGVEWTKKINKHFVTDIPATTIYDYPTLQKLSEHIASLSLLNSDKNITSNGSVINVDSFEEKTDSSISQIGEFEEVKNILLETLADILFLEKNEIEENEKFVDLGLDSITGVEWVKRIGRELNVSADTSFIYDYPNIKKLAQHIASLTKDNDVKKVTDAKSDVDHGVDKNLLADHISSKESTISKDEVCHTLITQLADVLYLSEDEIGLHDKFFDLGIDSIVSVEWLKKIDKVFSLKLNVSVLYDCSTIAQLTEHILLLISENESNKDPHAVSQKLYQASPNELQEKNFETRDLSLKNTSFIGNANKVSAPEPLKIKPRTIRINELDRSSQSSETDMPVGFVDQGKKHSEEEAKKKVLPPLNADKSPEMNRKITNNSDIAIIGMSGRFASSDNVDDFWQTIANKVNAIDEVPSSRWCLDDFYSEDPQDEGKTYSRWLGTIKDADCFDADFFGISPREAEQMDPQQRVFLEESWKAIEDAGYAPNTLSECRCGVFVGAGQGDYYTNLRRHGIQPDAYTLMGMNTAILSSRLSYYLNLKGTSLSLDTACSSSLVAIHKAAQSLLLNESDLALAGGVYISASPEMLVMTSKSNMLSVDGKCKAFDADANGFVTGEGVGVVVLKRLEDAIHDNDNIHAILAGSGTNQDGSTNGITAPSRIAQTELQQDVFKKFNINPNDIQLVEAHGTGTKLGDPIEVHALNQSFSSYTEEKQYCALGSVKSNIGHTLTAAGVASVIKVIQAIKHKKLPPSLHFNMPNEHIKFTETPFYVNTQLREWETKNNHSRLATVSSFGFSGTNAFAVIKEYISEKLSNLESYKNKPNVFLLSAKGEVQLKEYACQLLDSVSKNRSIEDSTNIFHRIAYTLQCGRDAMKYRLAIVTDDLDQLTSCLNAVISEEELSNVSRDDVFFSVSKTSFITENTSNDIQLTRASLNQCAAAWVVGKDFDWQNLYLDKIPQRISLPTYPFTRDRYWLPELNDVLESVDSKADQVQLMQEHWVPLQKNISNTSLTNSLKNTSVIDFVPDYEYAELMREALPQDVEYIAVLPGSKFTPTQDRFDIRADKSEDYLELFNRLKKKLSNDNVGILYRWQSYKATSDNTSLHHLHKIFSAIKNTSFSARWLTMVGVWQDSALASCFHQSWIGFRQSAKLIMPNLVTSIMYSNTPLTEETIVSEGFACSLIKNIEDTEKNKVIGNILRYIDGIPHKAEVTTVPKSDQQSNSSKFVENGCYVIVGGCGGIGYQLALYLADRYNADLVLVGRRIEDEKIAHQCQELLNKGARSAKYYSAEIHNLDSLQNVFHCIIEIHKNINGIIHSAGYYDAQPFNIRNSLSVDKTLASKTHGTIYLDWVTRSLNLDFMVYFSSSSALFGDFGSGDYAAGNRFQVAYAKHREYLRKNGECQGETFVINWPLWRDGRIDKTNGNSSEGHIDVDTYLTSSGQHYLQNDEAMLVLEMVLGRKYSQSLVLTGSLENAQRLTHQLYAQENSLTFEKNNRNISAVDHETNEQKISESVKKETNNKIHETVEEAVRAVLKIKTKKLDQENNFTEFGFDSISLTELSRYLSKDLNIDIVPSDLFNYSTIKKLSEFVFDKYQNVLVRKFLGASYEVPPVPKSSMNGEISVGEISAGKIDGNKDGNKEEEPQSIEVVENSALSKKSTGLPKIKTQGFSSPSSQEIAVIGMSGRFPSANNIDELWDILVEGKSVITEVPKDRWDWQDYFFSPNDERNKITTNKGGFIEGMKGFDPLFFEISPLEAEFIDPRQRLILQECWHAFEDAGYCAKTIKGKNCGVFIGAEESEYAQLTREYEKNLATGQHNGILAARISYFLNLNGPNVSLNTACSSGLVALHSACQALRQGDCEFALAGGVNLLISPRIYQDLSRLGMLSPHGNSFVFDEKADGIVPGEAAAVVLLKPLAAAERDGDAIYGVIKGSAINYDGKTNGITAPNGISQKQLIHNLYSQSGVNPEDISYVLAHGTGTRLGDPIEVNTLVDVLARKNENSSGELVQTCALASVKSNLGHTFAASGIVSFISALLAMKHKTLPPSVNYETLNPFIRLESGRLCIHDTVQPWTVLDNKSRIAAVSAFGMSGTNAHVVVEEYNSETTRSFTQSMDDQLIVVSARDNDRLKDYIASLVEYIKQPINHSDYGLADIAYTLQTGRDAMDARAAWLVSDIEQLVEQWQTYLDGMNAPFFGTLVNGELPENNTAFSVFSIDDEFNETLEKWMQKGKLNKIAELWVRGVDIDWSRLQSQTAKRVHLPGYPFAKDNYWLPEEKLTKSATLTGQILHPLLHENSSDIRAQKFSSKFSGRESFLADHLVAGKKVLPGVAQLMMAKTAAEYSTHSQNISLRNIKWLQPIVVKEDTRVEIALYIDSESQVEQTVLNYEIYSVVDADEVESKETPVIFGEGKILVEESNNSEKEHKKVDTPKIYSIDDIKSRCDQICDGDLCYEKMAEKGLLYGNSFRGIHTLYFKNANEDEGEALAEIKCDHYQGDECFPPGALDSALHTLLGLRLGLKKNDSRNHITEVPYGVGDVKFYSALPKKFYAYARPYARSLSSEQPLLSDADDANNYIVELLNEQGEVIVSFTDFMVLPLIKNTSNEFDGMEYQNEKYKEEDENYDREIDDLDILKEHTKQYLREMLASTLKIDVEKIQTKAPLEKYGIDSIMILNLTEVLEKNFGALPKTLFFEYKSLNALAEYFVNQYLTPENNEQFSRIVMAKSDANPSGKLVKHSSSNKSAIAKSIRNYSSRKEEVQNSRRAALIDERKDKNTSNETIAIIGVSGRYPQAENLEQFWDNLKAGKNCIEEIPSDRWNHTQQKGLNVGARWGGFVPDVDKFDPFFFNISPREAELMDPQERLFLETVWSTLEDAGYTRDSLRQPEDANIDLGANVGVYVGVMYEEYQLYGAEQSLQGDTVALSGNPASIANRISYFCNFRGPSMAIDTMCSSSLTAIHLACESLRQGQCTFAIAGGVNVSVHPNKYRALSQGNFLSDNGRCQSFGEGGNGYVPGEGVGAVLLKPLSNAKKDGDHIYGVIRGTSLNHGGKTNGYTVPNPIAQAEVIKNSLQRAAINPRHMSYIEAHGTGTSLGDPIEIRGLSQAFNDINTELAKTMFTKTTLATRSDNQSDQSTGKPYLGKQYLEKQYCAIGSAKSNIGHCESAAGIAGVSKVLLQLQHQWLVPSLHSHTLNPNIDFTETPFKVQQEGAIWERPVIAGKTIPRLAGVSSFGAGGSNAHVIIEEYVDSSPSHDEVDDNCLHVFPLSARKPSQLKEYAERLLTWLCDETNRNEKVKINLSDIEYTLQVGREHFDHRVMFLAHNELELKEALTQFVRGEKSEENIKTASLKNHYPDDEEFSSSDEREIANQWIQGRTIEWVRLHHSRTSKRISVPTYPFIKKRYWVPEPEANNSASIEINTTHKKQNTFSEKIYSQIIDQLTDGELSVDGALKQLNLESGSK